MTTWNPSDKDSDIVLSFGNTVATSSSGNGGSVRGTTSKSSGKYYFEVVCNTAQSFSGVGIADSTASLAGNAPLGGDTHSSVYYCYGAAGNPSGSGSFTSYTDGDIIGIAIDVPNSYIYFSLNGTWQNSAVPTSGINPLYYTTTNPVYPALYLDGSSGTTVFTQQFGPTFTYSAPSGFTAFDLNATNATLTGVSATGSAGIINPNSPDRSTTLVGVSATGSAGTISKIISPNISLTGVSATGNAGSILFGAVEGSMAISEASDTVSMVGSVQVAGTLVTSEAPDTVAMRARYGFIGWQPADIEIETWTER